MAGRKKAAEPKAEGGRRLQVDARRQQLLALGIELFSRRDPEEISIDEIAEAAGISKGLLYHYFGSKRDFYRAAIRLASEELLADTQAQVDTAEQEPLQKLKTGLDAYLGHVEARAEGFAILVTSGTADPEVRAIVDAARRAFVTRILEDLGLPEPPGLLRAALRGWIAFVETSSLDWLEHRDLSREALRDLLAQVLLTTLVAAGLEVPI
ncbi:MAG: TetR/AcrR family transcriptional regulator [Myxococcales bacterium]|nr:TetR/AcrR family transcriptional regulator [Myxococcales bacterium]